MPEGPLSATPYEVLGVASTVSQDELKRAYRRMLRQTHPDAGGSATRFHAVQLAWERIGTPEGRAAYDHGGEHPRSEFRQPHAWASPAASTTRRTADSRPKARSYGHPGGRQRERFLGLMREWVGLGEPIADPYDPALVRSAPREIRHALADALAEEATARSVATLGIGYTIWHDVATDKESGYGNTEKIDHVVLGPTGLFAVQSEDWGAPVRVRRSEVIGDGVAGEPLHELATRARRLGRETGVRFSVALLVVPDEATDQSYTLVGKARGIPLVLAQQSYLPQLLRAGLPDEPRPDGTELFEVRTRLQGAIRFA